MDSQLLHPCIPPVAPDQAEPAPDRDAQLAELLSECERASRRLNGKYGKLDPRALQAQRALGQALLLTGDAKRAARILDRVHERRWKVLGQYDPDTLESLTDLVRLQIHHGFRWEMHDLRLELLYAIDREFGKEDPRTLELKLEIARSHGCCSCAKPCSVSGCCGAEFYMGMRDGVPFYLLDHGRVIEMLTAVHEIRARQLGEHHPDTLEVLEVQADKQRDLGKRQAMRREVLETRLRVHGREHAGTLEAMTWDAQFGEHADAQARMRKWSEVIQATSARLGPFHEDTLQAMKSAAELLIRSGELTDATQILFWLVKAEAALEVSWRRSASTPAVQLEKLLQAQWDVNGLLELYKCLLEQDTNRFGIHHRATVQSAWRLYSTLQVQGESQQARVLLHSHIAWFGERKLPEYVDPEELKLVERIREACAAPAE